VFLHGIEAWQQQDWLSRTLLRRADLFVSNSEYTWTRFLSQNPVYRNAKHRTVHLGVGKPLQGTVPSPRQPPAVLMIARLARSEDYKGHRETIAAWPQVRQQIANAELWIVGDGDLRPDLEAMVRLQRQSHNIRFFGRVVEDEKTKLLGQCSCLALPSRAEGFGLVYLEAMRMGRPCLVSTLDAGREVVNPPEAGLSVDLCDTAALSTALCRLLTSGQEWRQWSEQARRRYEAHFTAVHFQQRLVEALNHTP
jgi:phosphatidylinositol alpha-1,6-mannosyltransferase